MIITYGVAGCLTNERSEVSQTTCNSYSKPMLSAYHSSNSIIGNSSSKMSALLASIILTGKSSKY